MRRTTTASRWTTLRRHYAGGWRQNPWINAVFSASQARNSSTRLGVADAIADRAVSRWENEGGSLGHSVRHIPRR